jgi:hypothetical protein
MQQLRARTLGDEGAGRTRAPWLIGRGCSLDVPRLDDLPLRHSSFGSDASAARFAALLLELGIASARDWRRCDGEPLKFLQRILDRFVREHGEAEIDGAFSVSVTLSTDPHEWCEEEAEPDGSRMFLSMDADSCGFVNLGPALSLCEETHPRLPTTFGNLFLNGLGRCFRVYDHRDAEERIAFLEEYYDPVHEADAIAAIPDRSKLLPACMKRRPLGRRTVSEMLRGMQAGNPVKQLVEAALALDRVAATVRFPPIPDDVRELFSDTNPTVPVLLATFEQGDAVEACFDDECQYMTELAPEPWPLIAFDGTNSESTQTAFEAIAGALDTLRAARRVLDLVPGWKPIDHESGE